MRTLETRFKQEAARLGFDDCRFTTALPPEHGDHFERWLSDGCHGEMSYLARNAAKRVDPALVLPGARTIITLAVSYHGNTGTEDSAKPIAAVARYARFKDYHDVLSLRLAELTRWLDECGSPDEPRERSLWYVDTGPILERDLAHRAGLGFSGKHTNLISRRLGNWFFVAEILTTVRLDPDEPGRNLCGTCERCIDACPTRAIKRPFHLDARLCISYLTIELKGSIPEHLRPAIGHRVFGCDDCLAACPWNRFAREGAMMRRFAREDLQAPDLVAWLAMDDEEFRRCFKGTPLFRTKRRGLLRNVCVVLGNIGDRSVLPALRKAVQDPEPLIAEHAAWAIRRIEERDDEPAR